jgi:hypothetical protein
MIAAAVCRLIETRDIFPRKRITSAKIFWKSFDCFFLKAVLRNWIQWIRNQLAPGIVIQYNGSGSRSFLFDQRLKEILKKLAILST